MKAILIGNACALVTFVLEQGKNFDNNKFATQLKLSFPDVDFDLLKQAVKEGRKLAIQERLANWEKLREDKPVEPISLAANEDELAKTEYVHVVNVPSEVAEKRRRVAIETQNVRRERVFMKERSLTPGKFEQMKWMSCLETVLNGENPEHGVSVEGETFLVSSLMIEQAKAKVAEDRVKADKKAEELAKAAEYRAKLRESFENGVPISSTQQRKMNRLRLVRKVA